MNITAIEYLNKANQDHQKAYNNYIKDCLLSSKPIKLSMKDFIKSRKNNSKQRQRKNKYEREMLSIIRQNQNEYPGIENIHLRVSLLQNHVMRMMSNANSLEEVKEIYTIYERIVCSKEI